MYYTDGGRSKNRDSTFFDYFQQHTYSLLLKSGGSRASWPWSVLLVSSREAQSNLTKYGIWLTVTLSATIPSPTETSSQSKSQLTS